jgi:hypothetical protein
VLLGHDTPLRLVSVESAGFGWATSVHLALFQRMIKDFEANT